MSESISTFVREKYGAVAESGLSSADAGVREVAQAFGYTVEELASIPAEANMGLSCGESHGNGVAQAGEVVVDLGSGGGLDVFLAAQKVGPAGKAIGIDMTPAMVERARKGASATGISNVAFHVAAIDQLPLEADSVDCIVSNCVINLAPDKKAVFREMFRVLKRGGRVAVSDIALKQELPEELKQDVLAYVGCIAGAIGIDAYMAGLKEAGFTGVQVVDSGVDLNAYTKIEGGTGCCSPAMAKPAVSLAVKSCCGPTCCGGEEKSNTVHAGIGTVLSKYDVNAYAASVKVFAIKG